jgi:hypothetical protein
MASTKRASPPRSAFAAAIDRTGRRTNANVSDRPRRVRARRYGPKLMVLSSPWPAMFGVMCTAPVTRRRTAGPSRPWPARRPQHPSPQRSD